VLRKLNLFFLFVAAPAIGFFLAYSQNDPSAQVESTKLTVSTSTVIDELEQLDQKVTANQQRISLIQEGATRSQEEFRLQQQLIDELLLDTSTQVQKSDDVLDRYLTSLLGKPIGQTFSERVAISVFSLEESGYRGYMAKVRIHDPNALKVVLANDSLSSNGEKTSQAAKRKNAVLAVNAGGFRKNEEGKVVPLGITVVDGKVQTFSTNTDLSFIGFNRYGHLVGGKFTFQQQLTDLGIMQGASFLPTLLENGKKVTIPKDWSNKKNPRTLIGHFINGDLLVIVIDGRRKGWSQGVTLEEAQNKLLEFKVRDAYNLDGGGSSVFYYKGKVLNRPSDGVERPVSTNLIITE
jgi:exopolysaccharide biosynthesis protein